MDTAFHALASALHARRDVISDRALFARDPEAHLLRLQESSREVERAAAGLPAPVPPQLTHFLQRGSYEKALAFLEDAISNG